MPKKTTKEKTQSLIKKDADSMASLGLLSAPLEALSTDEVHLGWSVLDLAEKVIKERKEEMRERLLLEAENLGKQDEKGSFILDLDEGQVKKEKRVARAKPDEALVRKTLLGLGVNPERVFVTRTVTEFSPEAFQSLVDEGIIPEDKAKEATESKITWALKVVPPPAVKTIFNKIKELK